MDAGEELLKAWGWDGSFAEAWRASQAEGLMPGRVVTENRGSYRVFVPEPGLEKSCRLSGRYRHEAVQRSDLPGVGDWVGVSLPEQEGEGVIRLVLPRKTCFSRRTPGLKLEEQIISANVDTAFLVMGLDGDFNLRRIERALALAYTSGADPVILLTKTDLHDDCSEFLREVESSAPGVPVMAISSLTGGGLEGFHTLLRPARTAAFLGSSGAGKSTLINRLMGEEKQKTLEVRQADSRGRHATTRRELFLLPCGALVIDNPGMRELQLWAADEGIDGVFPEISALAEGCRFRDCTHTEEPGCVVREALERGELPEDRYEGYLKLKREQAYLERRTDYRAMQEHKRQMKSISRSIKTVYRIKGKERD